MLIQLISSSHLAWMRKQSFINSFKPTHSAALHTHYHILTHTHTHTHIHIHTHKRKHTRTHTRKALRWLRCTHKHTLMHTHIHTHIHTHLHTHTHTHTRTALHCTHTNTRPHTTCTQLHTHIHTCTSCIWCVGQYWVPSSWNHRWQARPPGLLHLWRRSVQCFFLVVLPIPNSDSPDDVIVNIRMLVVHGITLQSVCLGCKQL